MKPWQTDFYVTGIFSASSKDRGVILFLGCLILEDGGTMFLWNVRNHFPNDTLICPMRSEYWFYLVVNTPFFGVVCGILRINSYEYSSYVVTLYLFSQQIFSTFVSFIGFVTGGDDVLLQVI